MTTETTELALFPKLNLPSVSGITEEMNKSFGTMYTRIEAGIAELPTDMSIKANREKVASYAYSISRTKTGLDEAAAGVSSDAKQIVDAVNGERRQLKNTLDILRDKARAKLTAWEIQEAARVAKVEDYFAILSELRFVGVGDSSEFVSARLEKVMAIDLDEYFFGDRTQEAYAAMTEARNKLQDAIARLKETEAQAAELEQFRREKAEREAAEAARKAEEERKAAEEAETARQEAERARIAQEAEERAIAVRVKNAETLYAQFTTLIERAMTAASGHIADYIETANGFTITDELFPSSQIGELCATQAETIATLQNMAIKRAGEEQEAAEKAIAERREAAKRAEAEQEEARKEAAARAEEEARRREEAAKEEERQRIADQARAKEKADQERAADLAHRKRLNSEAVAGLVKACGMTEKDAQAVVIAIYKEQVPHVAITY